MKLPGKIQLEIPSSFIRRSFLPFLGCKIITFGVVIALVMILFTEKALCIQLTNGSGAVIVEQIDFRGGPDSGVGEITIVRSLANSATGLDYGYINITNATGEWVVRNLPILPISYDLPSITTRFDLGVPNGVDVSSINLYIDYSPTPTDSFPGGSTTNFPVSPVNFAAGGVGNDLLDHYLPGPDLSGVIFNLLGLISLPVLQETGPNVQTARNQCAPMAVANSLQFLENTKGLNVPHDHKIGLRNDMPNDSLVGQLEEKMDRGVVSRSIGDGVWPLDGKLKYISENNLKDKLIVKHQGNGWTGGIPDELLDGTKDITRHGVTSFGKGAEVTWAWIYDELKKGEDVEIDIHFSGPNDGRHYVRVVGAGMILGLPYILHISDHDQTDKDPTDSKGTDKVDFALMLKDALTHPILADWNGRVDQAISESVKKPTLITIESFVTTARGDQILIEWTTGSEMETEGFNIVRSILPNGPFVKTNQAMIPSKAISLGGATYSSVDTSADKGVYYYYKLEEVDTKGYKTQYGPVAAVIKNIKDEMITTDVSLYNSGQNSKDRTTKESSVTIEEKKETESNYKLPDSIYTIMAHADAPARFLSGEVIDEETVQGIIINTKQTIEGIEEKLEIREKGSGTNLSVDTLSRETGDAKITVVEKYVSSLPSILFRIIDPEGYELAVASIDPNSEGLAIGENDRVKDFTLEKREDKGGIILTWYASEPVKGFHILRSAKKEGPYQKITKTPIPYIGTGVKGHVFRYIYTDNNIQRGENYYYKLDVINKEEGQTALR